MFERLADEDFCYLRTIGRRSGKPHEIEIWFAIAERSLYMLSGGREDADWVRNIIKDLRVRLRINTQTASLRARFLRANTREDRLARELLDRKYMGWREGKPLSGWAKTALPVAIDL